MGSIHFHRETTLHTKKRVAALAASALLSVVGSVARSALAHDVNAPTPQNVLQLSASATVEVQQDVLHITLLTTRDGTDAATLQTQLKTALDAALVEARKSAQPGQLDVRTGNFRLSPRYGRDGKINGWQGSTDLVLEGRDFPRIAQTAAGISTLAVGDVGFGLSREQRAKAEAEAQAMAITNFKQQATDLAKGFGFAAYTLREVSVNANQAGPVQSRMMRTAAASRVASDTPVPLEAGTASVVVNVSGSVQLK